MLLEEIQKMVVALAKGDSEEASAHFKKYASEKFHNILEKEKCDDDDKDYDKEDKDDDKDDDKKDSKKKKPDFLDVDKDGDKKESMKKAGKDKKEDKKEDEKDDVKENLAVKGGPADDKEGEYGKYRHNHDGEAYHKVPHKDTSTGYGHEKSKAASRNLEAKSDSGAKEKKKDAYKDTVHKDNSEGYGHEKSKAAAKSGLKKVEKKATSPDSDGKKENRRTDKTAKYHGTDRGGKEV